MGKTKENSKRVFIIVIVVAFLLSSIGFTGLVIWEMTKGKKDDPTADLQKQLQDQLNQQNKESEMQAEPLQGFQATPFDKASVSQLKVETLKEGSGAVAAASSTVKVNYFGWTSDGAIFDSSQKGGTASPIEFKLSEVIPGWTQGLTGVKAGSTVRLTIPGAMAYGDTDTGTGRPYGPLAFVVEVIEVK